MCFSAAASFVTAGVTGAIGLFAVARVQQRGELALAAFPIFFSVQQFVEGMLWLHLPGGADVNALTLAFLFFAKVFWPVYVPISIYLIVEPGFRRNLVFVCIAAGLAIALHLLWQIVGQSNSAAVSGRHILYLPEQPFNPLVATLYLAATILPLVLCSIRIVRLIGVVTAVGAIVSYVAYWDAFTSVWCFFAAAASALILVHFKDPAASIWQTHRSETQGALFAFPCLVPGRKKKLFCKHLISWNLVVCTGSTFSSAAI